MQVENLLKRNREISKTGLSVLIDPGKMDSDSLKHFLMDISSSKVSCLLIGGSLVEQNALKHCVDQVRTYCNQPIILFPGGHLQVVDTADAILFTSLISGRNAEWLIGQQVRASYDVWNSGIEVLPTGYVLMDGGSNTSVSYLSNTIPIPQGKDEILLSTVLAGKLMGMRHFYLESGSGAKSHVSVQAIEKVKHVIDEFIWVGGGIRQKDEVKLMVEAIS